MSIKHLAMGFAALALTACASGLPKDTPYSASSPDALLVLPNATGHIHLVSVDPDTRKANGNYSEYVDVSGESLVVQRVPAGSYILPSHSFIDHYSNLRFACVSPAPVFKVKAGTVNLVPMADPGIWIGSGVKLAADDWAGAAKEVLAEYPNVNAPVEKATMLAIAAPTPAKGYSCMKDSYDVTTQIAE